MEFQGLKTGSGSSIKVNKDALALAQSKYLDNENKEPMQFDGFKTGTGNQIKVNKEALALAQSKFFDNDTKESFQFEGFKTGSGSSIKVNKDALAFAQSKYLESDTKEIIQDSPDKLVNEKAIFVSNEQASLKAPSKCIPPTVNSFTERKQVEKKVPENRNAKSYKKPQLLVKEKLNKYVDECPSNTTNEINNNSIKNNFYENKVSVLSSISNETDAKFLSVTEGKNNLFFVNSQNNQTGVIRFKEFKLQVCHDEDNEAKFIVEPVFELINIDPK